MEAARSRVPVDLLGRCDELTQLRLLAKPRAHGAGWIDERG